MGVHSVLDLDLIKIRAKPASLCLFSSFSQYNENIVQNLSINGKSVNDVHGIQTQDRRLESADESTELWRPHLPVLFCF